MRELIVVAMVAWLAVILAPVCSSAVSAVVRHEWQEMQESNEAFNALLIEDVKRQRAENAAASH